MTREREPRARLTPSGPPNGGRVLEFRRAAVKPRRQRRSLWAAAARGLLGAVLVVGTPVAAAAWAMTSPRFALTELSVTAAERVPEAWVRARLAPLVGRNLLLLPLPEVDRALAGHPWIGSLSVAKALPSRLEVTVTQRRPAALVLRAGEPWFADAEGGAIAPVGAPVEASAEGAAGGPAGDPSDRAAGDPEAAGLLLVVPPEGSGFEGSGFEDHGIEGNGVPLALAVAAELAAAAPAWARELSRIDVLSEEDARLHTAALPCPLLVRQGTIGARADHLRALLPEVAARYPELAALDLRFSRRIVVEPAATPPVQAEERVET